MRNSKAVTATALPGLLCLLVLAGCPKKAVVAPRPSEPVSPAPEEEGSRTGDFRWNLGAVYFDFDKSDIRSGDATILKGNHSQMKDAAARGQKPGITIEGYCDPLGTSEYNMALGMRRADAAKAYLVRLGADAAQLSTISFGEEKLVTQDEAQFQLNRRCEFRVVR